MFLCRQTIHIQKTIVCLNEKSVRYSTMQLRWRELCTKEGKLRSYKKGEYFLHRGETTKCVWGFINVNEAIQTTIHSKWLLGTIKILHFHSYRSVLILDIQPRTHDCDMVGNDVEWNRFLTMYEESNVYAKAVFLKAHFFGQKFKATISRLSFTRSMVHFSSL